MVKNKSNKNINFSKDKDKSYVYINEGKKAISILMWDYIMKKWVFDDMQIDDVGDEIQFKVIIKEYNDLAIRYLYNKRLFTNFIEWQIKKNKGRE